MITHNEIIELAREAKVHTIGEDLLSLRRKLKEILSLAFDTQFEDSWRLRRKREKLYDLLNQEYIQ